MIRSCSTTLVTRLRSRARRELMSRPSLKPAFLCLMIDSSLTPGPGAPKSAACLGGSQVVGPWNDGLSARTDEPALRVNLHAEGEAQSNQDLLNLIQRLAAEVLCPQHLRLALLDKVSDALDVGIFQAVVGADTEFE